MQAESRIPDIPAGFICVTGTNPPWCEIIVSADMQNQRKCLTTVINRDERSSAFITIATAINSQWDVGIIMFTFILHLQALHVLFHVVIHAVFQNHMVIAHQTPTFSIPTIHTNYTQVRTESKSFNPSTNTIIHVEEIPAYVANRCFIPRIREQFGASVTILIFLICWPPRV
jgi:hypothetical protein